MMDQLPLIWDEDEAPLPRASPASSPAVEAEGVDAELEQIVNQIIGQVADKWTMLVLEELEEHGRRRFTQIARGIPAISQKMLTQTLRQMEREGLLTRTVHPVVPPHVDYELTELGRSLGEAFCGVWIWAKQNRDRIERARSDFDARHPPKA